jgi:hypothetical protein
LARHAVAIAIGLGVRHRRQQDKADCDGGDCEGDLFENHML